MLIALQETQSKITTLLQKEKSDTRSPDANDKATSSDEADQPTTPDTQHGIIYYDYCFTYIKRQYIITA